MFRRRNSGRNALAVNPLTSQRRLRFEPLEERRLLSITVNTLLDTSDGTANGTSLREALLTAPQNETIVFAPELNGGTIKLVLGQLSISRNVTINGPGADLLTIDASGNDKQPELQNGAGSRVFNINGPPNSIVNIRGLTLTGGDVGGQGGGIFDTNAVLNLAGMNIKNNFATT